MTGTANSKISKRIPKPVWINITHSMKEYGKHRLMWVSGSAAQSRRMAMEKMTCWVVRTATVIHRMILDLPVMYSALELFDDAVETVGTTKGN